MYIWVIIIACLAEGVVPVGIESEPVLQQAGALTPELRRTLLEYAAP
jgi:hypothetical protein